MNLPPGRGLAVERGRLATWVFSCAGSGAGSAAAGRSTGVVAGAGSIRVTG